MNQTTVPQLGQKVALRSTSNALPQVLSLLKYFKEELRKQPSKSNIQKNEIDIDFSDLALPIKKHIITVGVIQGKIFELSDCFACLRDSTTSLYLRGHTRTRLVLGITVIEELIDEVSTMRKSRFSSIEEKGEKKNIKREPCYRWWPKVYSREIEIMGLPQTVIRRLITKGILNGAFNKISGSVVSTRGNPFILGDKSQIPAGERPLYLLVEGPIQGSMHLAVRAIENMIKDVPLTKNITVPVMNTQNNNINSSQHSKNIQISSKTSTTTTSKMQPAVHSIQGNTKPAVHSYQQPMSSMQPAVHRIQGNTKPAVHSNQHSVSSMQPALQSIQENTKPAVHSYQQPMSSMQPAVHRIQGNTKSAVHSNQHSVSSMQPAIHSIQHSSGNTDPSVHSIQQSTSSTQLTLSSVIDQLQQFINSNKEPSNSGDLIQQTIQKQPTTMVPQNILQRTHIGMSQTMNSPQQMQAGMQQIMNTPQQMQIGMPQTMNSPQQMQIGMPQTMNSPQQMQTGMPHIMNTPQQMQYHMPQIMNTAQQMQTGMPQIMNTPQQMQYHIPQTMTNPQQMQTGMSQFMNSQQMVDNKQLLQNNTQETSLSNVIDQLQKFIDANKS